MSISKKIKEMRKMQGVTQEMMAEKMGLSVGGYANIENGKSKLDWDRLKQMAEIFQIDILQLVQAEQKGLVIQQKLSFQDTNSVSDGEIEHNNINNGSAHEIELQMEKKDLIIEHLTDKLVQKEKEIGILNDLIVSLKAQIASKN